ncbi:MAG: hypothetical protein Q9178_002702 [Gyalolechia marmorata]
MAPHPTPSFAALIHALHRRTNDYHYSLPSIKSPDPAIYFSDFTRRILWIEDALQRSPPLFSLEVHNEFTATLVQMQVEALDLQRDIEMNPSRVKRGAANAEDEGILDERRTECFGKWKAGLDAVWKGIMEKSERELKEENLQELDLIQVVTFRLVWNWVYGDLSLFELSPGGKPLAESQEAKLNRLEA